MSSQNSQTASNFIVSKVVINNFEITIQNIKSINIFEGITSPAITGRIYIADREGLLEIQETFTGDYIEIEFISKHKESNSPFKFKGIITSADGSSVHGDQTFPIVVLHFCSEWWFKAITKQTSKSYKNTSWGEIIRDLIQVECGRKLNNIYPPATKPIERFVTPYWTPAHIIKYILSWAKSDDEKTGYLIFEKLFPNFLEILNLEFGYEQLYEDEGGIHPSEIIINSENTLYEGNTNGIYAESYFNSMKYLNQGLPQTDFIAFDYDHTNVYTSSKPIVEYDHLHMKPILPLLKEYCTPEYKSIKTTRGPFHQQSTIHTVQEFEKTVDAVRNNNYVNLFGDMIKLNLILPGATNRGAGNIVKLNFPSINTAKDKISRHRYLEGYYMIRNIQHIFENDIYSQAMTVISDGIGSLKRTDLQEW